MTQSKAKKYIVVEHLFKNKYYIENIYNEGTSVHMTGERESAHMYLRPEAKRLARKHNMSIERADRKPILETLYRKLKKLCTRY